ncbi:hypothetical protein BKA80DRAFT_281876 [Phyllosticta citrichinensis]
MYAARILIDHSFLPSFEKHVPYNAQKPPLPHPPISHASGLGPLAGWDGGQSCNSPQQTPLRQVFDPGARHTSTTPTDLAKPRQNLDNKPASPLSGGGEERV